ncbi:hypothetical protein C0992_000766 [Termitomyces sp. T32_za158]|nr:hypothetical protein C0992_000766 [Termitomyces sp. T32_za158]
MHFKSLIIFACGLATVASAGLINLDKLVDLANNTLIAPAVKLTGDVVDTVEKVIQPRLKCTKAERQKIARLTYETHKLHREDIASFKKDVLGQKKVVLDAAAIYQPRIPFQGDPATCKELQDATETYERIKSGKHVYLVDSDFLTRGQKTELVMAGGDVALRILDEKDGDKVMEVEGLAYHSGFDLSFQPTRE